MKMFIDVYNLRIMVALRSMFPLVSRFIQHWMKTKYLMNVSTDLSTIEGGDSGAVA